MKVAIVGAGVVGKALLRLLSTKLTGTEFTFHIYDPEYGSSLHLMEMHNVDIMILCVPTPTTGGYCDYSIVRHYIEGFPTVPEIVVKSSITPNVVIELQKIRPNIIICPEFLRQEYADHDMFETKEFIIGATSTNTMTAKMFNMIADIKVVDPVVASAYKYVSNSFLATKVAMFNEYYNNFKDILDYSSLVELCKNDVRIGPTHMDVPGPDGLHGFGGACFPKDTQALVSTGEFPILESVIRENKINRAKLSKSN